MNIDVTKENLCINKIVTEKKEMIYVQGDMIIPDAKPDILNTISTCGNVCIYKKDILEGKLRVDGNVNIYIMYMADNEQNRVRGLTTNLDFSETINIPELRPEMYTSMKTCIKTIECKVLNGRKISIKVGIEFCIKVTLKKDVEIINKIEDDSIQKLERRLKINSLMGEGSAKAYAKDNITIDANEQLAEILKVDINVGSRDIKTSYNKVLVKSEIEVKILYLTENNKISSVSCKIPVVGFVDITNIQEENNIDTNYEIRNVIIKPNNADEHSIYVEIEMEISCLAYEEKEICILDDLYSTEENLEFTRTAILTTMNKQTRQERYNVREKVNIPELGNNDILDVSVTPIVNNENKVNNKIIYDGDLIFDFLFTDNSSVGVNTKQIKLPYEFTVSDVEGAEKLNIDTQIELENHSFNNQAEGEVDANIDMIFALNMDNEENINVIENITSSENTRDLEDYSIIIYIVKKGDTLWKIAKRFKSTVEDIVKANGIENPNLINVGEKLYIPKYFKKEKVETQKTMSHV